MTWRLVSPALLLCSSAITLAQHPSVDLSQSSMEELTRMEISISSVTRKEQSLFDTAAAAYVITRDDIAHSTADSIPELLRSVPGLQVAQINASTWAVSARGFNSAFANKLLVLIDGRTVYSELYSGEHWDEIDLPLADVERIEVIRGPGAVVWGTNAVNGVINIITRPARAVSAPTVSGLASRMDYKSLLQDGAVFANGAQLRGFFSSIDRRPLETADGSEAFGGEKLYRVGARLDWRKSSATNVAVLAGAYGGPNRQYLVPGLLPVTADGLEERDTVAGGYGLLRIEHRAERNSYEVQGYFSSADRQELGTNVNTLTEDIDAVDHFQAGRHVDFVTGGELRLTQDLIQAPIPVTRKASYDNFLLDGFAQADIQLLPGRLKATLGSKIQDGTLAGFQLQPSARIGWNISPSQFFWSAISRSAVAPALQDKELLLGLSLGAANGLPIVGVLTGNPDYKPETVVATEFGYRKHFTHALAFDLAAYLNDTRRIQSSANGAPALVTSPSPEIDVPLLYVNGFSAKSQGLEASLDWRPTSKLQLRGNYTWLEAQLTQVLPGSVGVTDGFNSARNTFDGLAYWSINSRWSLKGMLYRVGAVSLSSGTEQGSNVGSASNVVSGFTRLDLAAESHVGSKLKFSAGGTNLTSARHLEFGGFTTFVSPLYVPRSLFLRASWSF